MSQQFATIVIQQLTQAGYTAYWAGGCVRDLLLGKTPSDFDVATSATPDQVRAVFGPRRTLAVGESFGVIIVLGPKGSGEQVEVATFRSEGSYSDGRRPDAVTYSTPELDAQRRDFTINGLFYDPVSQTVHDFVGGQADLGRKIVRAIGNPRDRMREDKLRMLRAVRFTALLGYSLDPETANAVRDMHTQVLVVSAERIAVELRKMLGHARRSDAMRLCADLRLLEVIIPELQETTLRDPVLWEQRLAVLSRLGDSTTELGMAALLAEVPAEGDRRDKEPADSGTVLAICRRLKLSNEQTDQICWLSAQRGVLAGLPEASLARVKRLVVNSWFSELLCLERVTAEVRGESLSPVAWVEDFLRRTPQQEMNPPELINGRDLISLGYTPGPNFKTWLDTVRDAQLNGEITTRDQAISMVKDFSRIEQ